MDAKMASTWYYVAIMILSTIIEYLAPAECVLCGREGEWLCAVCEEGAVIRKAGTCYRCNALSDGGRTCAACRRATPLSGVIVASHYDGPIKDLVGRIKYYQAASLARPFARMIAARILVADFDVIVPVPTTAVKRRARGYNQAAVICNGMSSVMGIPVLNGAVIRQHATETQTRKHRTERWENVKGSFKIAKENELKNKHLLLVDDVITTGATLEACGNVIMQVENIKLGIATLAYVAK